MEIKSAIEIAKKHYYLMVGSNVDNWTDFDEDSESKTCMLNAMEEYAQQFQEQAPTDVLTGKSIEQIKDEVAEAYKFENGVSAIVEDITTDRYYTEVGKRYAQQYKDLNAEMIEMLEECKRVLGNVQSPATPAILLRREVDKLITKAKEV